LAIAIPTLATSATTTVRDDGGLIVVLLASVKR